MSDLFQPSCIDLLLTNSQSIFKEATVFSLGLTDFHKLVRSVLKTIMQNKKPKEIFYRGHKYFDNGCFSEDLINAN